MVDYDYDEFIDRLMRQGCKAERTEVHRRADGRTIEVWVISRGGRERSMQIGPGDTPPPARVVEMIVRDLDLPYSVFGL